MWNLLTHSVVFWACFAPGSKPKLPFLEMFQLSWEIVLHILKGHSTERKVWKVTSGNQTHDFSSMGYVLYRCTVPLPNWADLIQATVALHETMAFDKAVVTALEMTNPEETLIIVTADHGHSMTMAGYPKRGTDIRGQDSKKCPYPGQGKVRGFVKKCLQFISWPYWSNQRSPGDFRSLSY